MSTEVSTLACLSDDAFCLFTGYTSKKDVNAAQTLGQENRKKLPTPTGLEPVRANPAMLSESLNHKRWCGENYHVISSHTP